ncbi:MAG: hypothetical protein U0804_18805 [Gemmataceae bacterium]
MTSPTVVRPPGKHGIGAQWGLHRDRPGEVLLWDARWGSEFEVVGDSALEAWRAEQRFYDEVSGA